MNVILKSFGDVEGLIGIDKLLIVVPLESIPNRYTDEWRKWVETAAITNSVEDRVYIQSRTRAETRSSANFNTTETMLTCRAQQIKELLELLVRRGKDLETRVFFMDIWSMGLEAVAYLRDMEGYNIKIEAFYHAGVSDADDRLAKNDKVRLWGWRYENMACLCCDTIYVATEFSKSLIEDPYNLPSDKIKVVNMPTVTHYEIMDVVNSLRFSKPAMEAKLTTLAQDEIVFFPHRMTEEKGYKDFEYLKTLLPNRFKLLTIPDVEKYLGEGVTLTKSLYFWLLCNAKHVVSFARQETFGLAMMEAFIGGYATVHVPDTLCYSELYSPLKREERLHIYPVDFSIKSSKVLGNKHVESVAWRILQEEGKVRKVQAPYASDDMRKIKERFEWLMVRDED